ncbi:hypothetical protein RhiirA4_497073 [Rhizophagus irregularis]|uniref:Uncharacterized protein n=1 Tax=Rhizophagus irregularis TaxID=588596 RepID=A0A2I1H154_9GLOM|nr:hypothetical protein RhiirA4_497073 [Rhizophagus irregularis]
MGNNKKKNNKASASKHSSQILHKNIEQYPNDFSLKVLNPIVSGGDVVKPATYGEKHSPVGPVTAEIFYSVVSVARAKARQQLDSLSSQYQNSLPSLVKTQQPQPNKKGKLKDQSNQHVSIETYVNQVINESMNIDEPADPSIAVSQLNQEGNLGSASSTPSTTTPIGTAPSNDITQSEEKNKRVLEISFKPQHKYQSVWTKMILHPLIDTDFVIRTWWERLDDVYVRWYLGFWKLKDHKEREKFQAKITIPSDAPQEKFERYYGGRSFDQFILKDLKGKSCVSILDKNIKQVIVYFESQKALHNALEVEQDWKMTTSQSPYTKHNKSKKDKKKNLKSLKGKKADSKDSTFSNTKNSRNKSKNNKKTNNSRWILKLDNRCIKVLLGV